MTKTENCMARLILIMLISIIGVSSQCQMTLSASKLIQDPGDEFFVDISALNGFDSVGALQFAMKWDSSVIEFLDIDTFGLPTTNVATHFSFLFLESGLLPLVWLHPSLGTVDYANNTPFLRLKFKAIGAPSTSTLFEFVATTSASIKVLAGSDFHQIDVAFDPGEVKLTPVLAIGSISELKDVVVSPNPSSQDIKVSFSLNQPVDLTWTVCDLLGKQLKFGHLAQTSGAHIIEIDREIFPETGIYLFSVRSAQGVFSRKLIVQQ